METGALIFKNPIDVVIQSIKEQLKSDEPIKFPPVMFTVPPPRWVLNKNTYKGLGRPRKSDYNYVDLTEDFKLI